VFEPDVPRSKVGFNEYMYALSRRHPAAVWAAGRGRNCRWELDPIAAGLRTLHVKLHQQYESPAAVMELVRRV